MISRGRAEEEKDWLIGSYVLEARIKSNLSQATLGARVSVSRDTIYRIETNRLSPSVTLLRRIAKALNTTVSSLLRSEG